MTRAPRRALAISLAVAALLAFAAAWQRPWAFSTGAIRRPGLLLLTSLPLVFNEEFGLERSGSPALRELGKAYRVVPISVTSSSQLAGGKLLLMAHAQAQTAENLVALDSWVRNGGRVVILADPLLEWPSKTSLGDPLRPSPMFMDTGLLAHWGLRLDEPAERGPRVQRLGSYQILTVSPGRLAGECEIRDQGFDAFCKIGKGQAIVIADADFLNTPALGPGAGHNLDALLEQLAHLARP